MLPLLYPDNRPSPWPTGEDIGSAGSPRAKVWIPENPLLVLGYSQAPEVELHVDVVTSDLLDVYKRRGGGGAVYLDAGTVCVAIRFPKRADWGIAEYFGAGNGLITRVLRDTFGIETFPRGISDLAVETPSGTRKILGSSLHLPREHGLYLASLLVSAPVAKLDRYLRHPSREPDYRAGRSHGEFVVNLSELKAGITVEKVKEAVEWELQRDQRSDIRHESRGIS